MRKHKSEKNLKWREDGPMGPGWRYDFKLRRKRFRGFAGYSREAARRALTRTRMEKLDEVEGRKVQMEPIRFSDFADEWLEQYSKVNKRSWTRDEFSIAHLKAHFKDKLLSEVKAPQAEAYKAARLAAGVSHGTINRELACLRTILFKAVEWGKLEAYPLPKRKLLFKESNHRDRILTDSEARRLIEMAKGYLRPVLILLLNTGMRKSEALGLKWENVDFHKGFLYVGADESKTGKGRYIPMNEAVFKALTDLKEGSKSEFVFANNIGRCYHSIDGSFKAACDAAKVKGVTLHTLRHTFGSRLVESGADLATVKELMGHSSIVMTQRYLHPAPEAKRRAVEKLSEIFGQEGQKGDTVILHRPVSISKHDN